MTTVWEKVGRSGTDSLDKSDITRLYIVKDAADETAVAAAINSYIPVPLGSLLLSNFTCKEISPGDWEVTVKWVSPEHPDRKDNEQQPSMPAAPVRLGTPGKWSRSVQLGTQRVNVALAGVRYPANARDMKCMIEWDPQSGAKGTDRYVISYEWSFEKCLAYASFTESWLESIDALALTVNPAAFYWMPADSALFLGANLTPEETAVRVVLRFVQAKNDDDLEIAGITGIVKGGHEYLWASYKTLPVNDGATGKALAPSIDAIYVDQLYPKPDNWDDLEDFIGLDAVGGPS